jgi:hypothetical protein
MDNTRVFRMAFASVYPHYIAKAEKKGRTKDEVPQAPRINPPFMRASSSPPASDSAEPPPPVFSV